MGLLESHVPLANITVMVQKEVAERMQAEPGTKEYGALSLAVQYYAKPYLAANVPPNCFMPRPNVGSAVIRLDCLNRVPIEVSDEKLMFRLIRASFNQRRKTLQNGLANSPELSFSKEEIKSALEAMELSPTIRGEKLSLAQFAALADELKRFNREVIPMSETMADYEDQINASFRSFREGDTVTGEVVSVEEEEVLLDLRSFSQGVIPSGEYSDDPNFHAMDEIRTGEMLTAVVLSPDDGQGRVLLSLREAKEKRHGNR